MKTIVKFRAPMPFDAYCRKLRLPQDDPASLERWKADYVRFRGD